MHSFQVGILKPVSVSVPGVFMPHSDRASGARIGHGMVSGGELADRCG